MGSANQGVVTTLDRTNGPVIRRNGKWDKRLCAQKLLDLVNHRHIGENSGRALDCLTDYKIVLQHTRVRIHCTVIHGDTVSVASHWQHAVLLTCFPDAMYQIVFNEISAAEMAKIPKKLQLELLAEFQFLPENLDHLDSKSFGVIEREGKKLYRYRASDYRIYFARTAEGILVHRVLHKNTIGDFLFRSKLPLAEDEQLEQSTGFWKLIEEGERGNAGIAGNERERRERA
jgi:mRNA-degrading endonuclease RelE of RelBE toxin-antitoxin system